MIKPISLIPLIERRFNATLPKDLAKKGLYAKPTTPRAIKLDGRSIIAALSRTKKG